MVQLVYKKRMLLDMVGAGSDITRVLLEVFRRRSIAAEKLASAPPLLEYLHLTTLCLVSLRSG